MVRCRISLTLWFLHKHAISGDAILRAMINEILWSVSPLVNYRNPQRDSSMPQAFWRHLTSHLEDSLSLNNYFTARKKKTAWGFQLQSNSLESRNMSDGIWSCHRSVRHKTLLLKDCSFLYYIAYICDQKFYIPKEKESDLWNWLAEYLLLMILLLWEKWRKLLTRDIL